MSIIAESHAAPIHLRGRSRRQQRRHEEAKRVFGANIPMFVREIDLGDYVAAARLLKDYVDGLDPQCDRREIRLAARWLKNNELAHA